MYHSWKSIGAEVCRGASSEVRRRIGIIGIFLTCLQYPAKSKLYRHLDPTRDNLFLTRLQYSLTHLPRPTGIEGSNEEFFSFARGLTGSFTLAEHKLDVFLHLGLNHSPSPVLVPLSSFVLVSM